MNGFFSYRNRFSADPNRVSCLLDRRSSVGDRLHRRRLVSDWTVTSRIIIVTVDTVIITESSLNFKN